MTIDLAQAYATRRQDDVTVYFCSERCVQLFDRDHASSATTGFSPDKRLRRIELAVRDGNGRPEAAHLEERLLALPGVRQVTVDPKSRLVQVVYAPEETQIETLISQIRAAGYTVGTASTQLDIQGMHCASCVIIIEEALQQTPGVLEATVNLATQQAHIVYVPGLVDRFGLVRAIEAAGYQVHTATAPAETMVDRAEQDRAREYAILLRKFWCAALISVPVIILSYPQLFPGLRDWLPPGSAALRLAWAALGLLTLPIIFWAGNHFYIGMWQALKHRQANMHTLIAVGISAAWLYSSVAVAFP
jgi:Cu+-exporting ATPase